MHLPLGSGRDAGGKVDGGGGGRGRGVGLRRWWVWLRMRTSAGPTAAFAPAFAFAVVACLLLAAAVGTILVLTASTSRSSTIPGLGETIAIPKEYSNQAQAQKHRQSKQKQQQQQQQQQWRRQEPSVGAGLQQDDESRDAVLANLVGSMERLADKAKEVRHAFERDEDVGDVEAEGAVQQHHQQQQHRQPPQLRHDLADPPRDRHAENARRGPPKPRSDRTSDVAVSWQAVKMCRAALWETLKTCTTFLPRDHPEAVHGDAFVITGDIDDLWLRDSAAQVHPYIPLTPANATLARLVEGLARRHAFYIDYAPYANAFRLDTNYVFSDTQKAMGRHGYISTYDYELDSGCYFVRMLYTYWQHNPDRGRALIASPDVKRAIVALLDIWTAEQHHEEDKAAPNRGLYRRPHVPSERGKPWTGFKGLARNGKGTPVAYTGMTWSAFRPSDDEQQYGYLVPSNMFAVVALGQVEEMAAGVWRDAQMGARARRLREEIDDGIQQHAVVQHPQYGRIYAYEVDGLGNHLLMDDANVPSLLSIPYLGYSYNKEVYANTRRFLLSKSNPTYVESRDGRFRGIGSVHMKGAIKDNIWPMSLIIQGLTSESAAEKKELLDMLVTSTGGTGKMHESFDANNPKRFTRKWFAWANALFAEFVQTLTDECN